MNAEPLQLLSSARPLLPIDVAALYLDTDRDGVIGRMEDGVISHAWDLGTGEGRRELRFFWRSLIAARNATGAQTLTDETVYAEVLPVRWAQPRVALLYRRFWCSQQLFSRLLETRELRACSRPENATDSPLISRDSAIAFLKKRRVL